MLIVGLGVYPIRVGAEVEGTLVGA